MKYLEIEVLIYSIVSIGQVLPYSSDSISLAGTLLDYISPIRILTYQLGIKNAKLWILLAIYKPGAKGLKLQL